MSCLISFDSKTPQETIMSNHKCAENLAATGREETKYTQEIRVPHSIATIQRIDVVIVYFTKEKSVLLSKRNQELNKIAKCSERFDETMSLE